MDEDVFNMELRKFLKKVGVTSQREIEQAVREGLEAGDLTDESTVKARMVLTLEGMDGEHVIEGEISLS